MPKETFLNLAEERRQAIINVLLKNFSEQHISQVKVSAIVSGIGMSRGAFYKYFEDLEDAYRFTISYFSAQIHRDILQYIEKDSQDFFLGIENYLGWCATLKPGSNYWQTIKLLTESTDLNNHRRRDIPDDSSMLKGWYSLLSANHFAIDSKDEALSFLYFTMDLTMDTLTDFIANRWSKDQLIQEFRFKRKWLESGIK